MAPEASGAARSRRGGRTRSPLAFLLHHHLQPSSHPKPRASKRHTHKFNGARAARSGWAVDASTMAARLQRQICTLDMQLVVVLRRQSERKGRAQLDGQQFALPLHWLTPSSAFALAMPAAPGLPLFGAHRLWLGPLMNTDSHAPNSSTVCWPQPLTSQTCSEAS